MAIPEDASTPMQNGRTLSLTPELVARVHRDIEDPGPLPEYEHLTDDDYDAMVRAIARDDRAQGGLDLFACGSLIWKPCVRIESQAPALLRGWHRRYCIYLRRWRGTRERPGLMMALDRGGACRGVVQRLAGHDLVEQLHVLLRREMSTRPPTQAPRWVTVESDGRARPAIAFCINRNGPAYWRDGDMDAVADILADACGHWGSCAEYLMNTVAHLEALGIHDRYLWRLQEMVADRIRART